MKIKNIIIALLFLIQPLTALILTWSPLFPTADDTITIIYDATQGNGGLVGATEVYAHTGVITEQSSSLTDWRYVKTNWGVNTPETRLEALGGNKWRIKYHILSYYGVPQSEKILNLAFVFRNAASNMTGRNVDGSDIYLPVDEEGLNVVLVSPATMPLFAELHDSIDLVAVGSNSDSLILHIDGRRVLAVADDTLQYTIHADEYGKKQLIITAKDATGATKSISTYFLVNPQIINAEVPAGTRDGINYSSATRVVLQLHAPLKEFIYVIGDFNDWEADTSYFMRRTPDNERWWLIITNLQPGKEYAFQYLVDGVLRIADPYTDKTLDPWNDGDITAELYPDLMPYPADKTTEIAAVLQTAQTPYTWNVSAFQKPPVPQLVIYELLARDFIAEHSYAALIDTLDYLQNLGINAIELMPINEFEGNSSWGYNPSFYFAPDKYYGPKDDLKRFIDEAHKRGMAVIQDIVLNHAYGQCPLVRLYADDLSASPWFNETSPNPDYYWGYDFNHESAATKAFVDSVLQYWVSEYNMDGYRLDFTKGFTNTPGNGWYYDAARIAILKRLADRVWQTNPATYLILEHLTNNTEEKELAEYGFLLWGNMNSKYSEAAMGYHEDSKSDLSGASYKQRGWNVPHLVSYMESHDEERLMYKNLQYGNHSGSYDIQELPTALDRVAMAAAFFFTIPGPKMLWQFGELGYDYSINYNDRTGEKPIRWDYFTSQERRALYDVFAALINLKTQHETFNSSSYILSVAGSVKKIKIEHESMDVVIFGNFGVSEGAVMPNFYHTGCWYDYFSGDSIEVTDTAANITLAAGEYHIYTDVRLAKPVITDIRNTPPAQQPVAFNLAQNYPNPFNPTTVIGYSLPAAAQVTLEVYNMMGQRVTRLVQAQQQPGVYQASWNGLDAAGRPAAAGVYLYRLQAGPFVAVRKMVLVR